MVTYGPECKDANEHLCKYGIASLRIAIEQAAEVPLEGIFTAADLHDDLRALFDNGFGPGAETGWEDGVLRAGRGKMIQMLRESPDSLDQWGTLSPEYPDVEWHSKLIALRCMEGKRLEFRLVENRGTSSRELLLEYILPR